MNSYEFFLNFTNIHRIRNLEVSGMLYIALKLQPLEEISTFDLKNFQKSKKIATKLKKNFFFDFFFVFKLLKLIKALVQK